MGSLANILSSDKGHCEMQKRSTERFPIRGQEGGANVRRVGVKGNYFSDWKSETSLPRDFCLHSSLHGLKYIVERRQHFVERMFWTIAFTTGLVVACVMISDVWEKYKNNSVIITFAPYETKIEEIPFPAVTICNMNKILKSKAIKIINDAKGFSGLEKRSAALENLYYLSHVCSTSKSFTKMLNFSGERGKIEQTVLGKANRNGPSYDGGKEDVWKFFQQASPPCHGMILKCIWQNEVRNCTELFTPLETDNGKCCTFNMVPPSILHRFNMTGIKEDPNVAENWEWDGESLIKSRRKIRTAYPEFPRRQKIPGQSFGLSILLNPGLEEYFCTSSDSHGFRMTAHLPIDVPHISDFGLAIRPNSEVFINIRPEVTIADKATIGSFPTSQRECYFPGELDLRYYKFYTAKNCLDECLGNLTYLECNCRRHFNPGEDSKPLCGPKQFHCASMIKRKFVGDFKTRCKMCIPACNEITYHTETTYTPLQDAQMLWTSNDEPGRVAPWASNNCSIVHIYFGEDSTNAKLRKELYGVIDLIANFGGLMGLCLGFSGLSLIELIYFLTLRAWCRLRRERHHQHHILNEERGDGGGRPLKRSETTTELIDYFEEEQEEGYLEMRAVNSSTAPMPDRISVISKGITGDTRGSTDGVTQINNSVMEVVAVGIDDLLRSVASSDGAFEKNKEQHKQHHRPSAMNL